jgi:hypothetical protein
LSYMPVLVATHMISYVISHSFDKKNIKNLFMSLRRGTK